MTIRDKRERLGWTRQQLAEKIGRSPEHVANIENGHARPAGEILGRIANALGCDISEITQTEAVA